MKKIVATIDICSSTQIIEELIKTSNIKLWPDMIIRMNNYLTTELPKLNAFIYKFIGDGWIILFNEPYSSENIIKFLSNINIQFEKEYRDNILPKLNISPEINGLTFGMDEGELIQITLQEKTEYVGRAMNIACRLQGLINNIDIKGGYRVFISHTLYNDLNNKLENYYPNLTERPLRNIEDKPFSFARLIITNIPFRIVEARYGNEPKCIDVTTYYTKHIKNGKLDVVVGNHILDNYDPDPGEVKILKIKYYYNNELKEREFKEYSRIQLP
jgi:class 3 adenylate cyclase